MTLPIAFSVPHAGLEIPAEVAEYCQLIPEEIAADGDEGAAEIYDLADEVAAFATTNIARAIVDLNRAEDDFRADGVIKTHTCWNVPVYRRKLPDELQHELIDRYWRPYHEKLAGFSKTGISLAVDCHTMAAVGPPIGPGAGQPRPAVCLGDGKGTTLPDGWMAKLAACFREEWGAGVTINQPFSGGYITRSHGREMPWLQLELSRDPQVTGAEKRARVLRALTRFCE